MTTSAASSRDIDFELVRARVASSLFSHVPTSVRLGRFELVRRLGSGTTGVVYEAVEVSSGVRLAIKLVGRLDGAGIAAFKREFRSLAGIVYPNLVMMHELFEERGLWFLSMDLIAGVHFTDWVRPAGVLDERRLRDGLAQLFRAIDAIHAADKLHRDLKPSNVMVTHEGRVVVLDFGLAYELSHALERDRLGSGLAGTLAYVSPEQAAGGQASQASDWYAVGVMLFEALTGDVPFAAQPSRMLSLKQEQEPPKPDDLVRDLPRDLCQLCSELLRRDREQRLQVIAGQRAPRMRAPQTNTNAVRARGWRFVGREPELAAFERGRQRVRAGEQAVLLIGGHSGIGKSALLEHFASLATDAVVLSGRCHVQEFVPYKGFDGVIDALSAHLRTLSETELNGLLSGDLPALLQVFPTLGQVRAIAHAARAQRSNSVDDRDRRDRAFAALKALLRKLGEHTRLVVLIDDLQWSDRDSALMLEHVLGPPHAPALLFAGAYRSDEIEHSEFLQLILGRARVADDHEARRIELGPLTLEAATDLGHGLLREEGVADEAALAERLSAESACVPFLILELVHYLSRQQAERPRAAQTLPPISLERALCERVESLPRSARELLCVLSVVAAPVEHDIAFTVAGLSTADRAALALLTNVHLAKTRLGATEWIEAYHDRVRETVVASMEPQAVKRVHARMAAALEARGNADPERLFVHYREAGKRLQASETALRAAASAVTALAFDRAAKLLAEALELLPPDDARRRQLQDQLGQALANAGRGALAAEAFLRAAVGADPDEALRLRCVAVRQYLCSGRNDSAVQLFEALLAEIGLRVPRAPTLQVAHFLWSEALGELRESRIGRAWLGARRATDSRRVAVLGSAMPQLSVSDTVLGLVVGGMYLRAAAAQGDGEHLMRARFWDFTNKAAFGDPERSPRIRRAGRQMHELAAHLDTPSARALADTGDALVALLQARPHATIEPARRAEMMFREQCIGATWEAAFATLVRLSACEHVGALSEVFADVPRLQQDARDRDDQFAIVSLAYLEPLAWMARDDPATASAIVETQQTRLQQPWNLLDSWVEHRRWETVIYQGKARESLAAAQADMDRFMSSHLAFVKYLRAIGRFLHARMLLAAYPRSLDAQIRRSIMHDLRDLRRMSNRPDAWCFARLVEAALAQRAGNERLTMELLRRVIDRAAVHKMAAQVSYAVASLRRLEARHFGTTLMQPIPSCDVFANATIRDPERWVNTFSVSLT